MQLMQKEVTTFAGFYWADTQLDSVMYLKLKMPEYYYIIGMGSSMMGFMAEGFDSISMTAMNIYPQMVKELYDYMLNFKMQEAYVVKGKMVKSIYDMFPKDSPMDWFMMMKMQMNKLYPFKMGPMRKPKITKMMF